MSEDAMYNVEKILDRRMVKNKLLYKIKWEGYPMNQCTWEPLENLSTVSELVEEYDKSHPKKQNKKGKSKNNLLGQKKELPPEEKKDIIKIIDKKPEVAQEEERDKTKYLIDSVVDMEINYLFTNDYDYLNNFTTFIPKQKNF